MGSTKLHYLRVVHTSVDIAACEACRQLSSRIGQLMVAQVYYASDKKVATAG